MNIKTPSELPIVLVTFNRPDHTQQVVDSLRLLGAQNLFIFSDAPRNDGDREAVTATRQIIKSIDWTTPFVRENETNKGLADNIRTAVDLVFEQEDVVILLEDDCVPQQFFLRFMYDCLQKYEDHPRVFGISGYSIPIPDSILDSYAHDVYFYPRIGSWGWATWKAKWQHHDRDLDSLLQQCKMKEIDISQGGSDVPLYVEQLKNGQLKDVWTLHWILSVYLNEGYYIYPTRSHIENIGMDGSGVHCTQTSKFNTTRAQNPANRFPPEPAIDEEIYSLFRSFYDLEEVRSSAVRQVNISSQEPEIASALHTNATNSPNRIHLGVSSQKAPAEKLQLQRLGSEGCAWTCIPSLLDQKSVVYCVGCGEDISFDTELMRISQCDIFGFDPTPRSLAYMRSLGLPDSYKIYEYGLADFNGQTQFNPPVDPTHVSHTIAERPATNSQAITVEMRRLATVMAELGHNHIDLLKMDIEGAEYQVVKDMLISGIFPDQILVEFHHFLDSWSVANTLESILMLVSCGYTLFSVHEHTDYCFVRSEKLGLIKPN
jgi:FkbM family methyltransferase